MFTVQFRQRNIRSRSYGGSNGPEDTVAAPDGCTAFAAIQVGVGIPSAAATEERYNVECEANTITTQWALFDYGSQFSAPSSANRRHLSQVLQEVGNE